MNILILNPNAFVTYRGQIGLVLYTPENHLMVNFFNGDDHCKANRSKLGSPSMEKLEEVLLENPELRELAYEHNLIEIHKQQVLDFLQYANSYN